LCTSSFPQKWESQVNNQWQISTFILANRPKGVLYIGLTNELERKLEEHKSKRLKGFTSKYNVDKLVYFEEFETYEEAFTRGK
jgi:putative endonuclease